MSAPDAADETRQRLTRWIAERMPYAGDLRLSAFERPGAGESSDTQLFTVHWRERGEP